MRCKNSLRTKMSGFNFAVLKELFGTEDFYQVLKIDKTADESQVRKAYYKTCLRIHPDKVKPEERELATKKFQALGAVYKILSDKNSRVTYDIAGSCQSQKRKQTLTIKQFIALIVRVVNENLDYDSD